MRKTVQTWCSALQRATACGLGLVLLATTGCSRLKQQVKQSIDGNQQMRQQAVEAARKSCVQTASAKVPRLPGMEARIQSYCDCFATKGMGKFSNSELTSISLHGGEFTPDQMVKMREGVQLCQTELTGKGR